MGCMKTKGEGGRHYEDKLTRDGHASRSVCGGAASTADPCAVCPLELCARNIGVIGQEISLYQRKCDEIFP